MNIVRELLAWLIILPLSIGALIILIVLIAIDKLYIR